MEWKTLATLALGLAAGVVAALVPDARWVAMAVAGACLGINIPQPKTWGKQLSPSPQGEQQAGAAQLPGS